jgi:hypothetical protein
MIAHLAIIHGHLPSPAHAGISPSGVMYGKRTDASTTHGGRTGLASSSGAYNGSSVCATCRGRGKSGVNVRAGGGGGT